LQDLAGYIVYWGTESGNYPHSETIASPGATSFVVTNLLPGQTYFFAVTAYNNGDLESGFSNEGSKSIQ
jgi:fibronectin type 3 domain-containing protein